MTSENRQDHRGYKEQSSANGHSTRGGSEESVGTENSRDIAASASEQWDKVKDSLDETSSKITNTVKKHPTATACCVGLGALSLGLLLKSKRKPGFRDRLGQAQSKIQETSKQAQEEIGGKVDAGYAASTRIANELMEEHDVALKVGATALLTGATAALLGSFANSTRSKSKSSVKPSNTPYEERTREELYDVAREREIDGRSAMSKSELIEALRH